MNRASGTSLLLLLALPSSFVEAQVNESVDVTLVNVDVLVSDKKGDPVPQLAGTDFELREDKKRVKVQHFRVADSDVSLLVYVDDYNLRAANRDGVLDALEPFLERQMASGELPVMVFSFDGTLRVRQGLTHDFSAVQAGFAEIRAGDRGALRSDALQRTTANTVQEALSLAGGSGQERRMASQSFDAIVLQLQGYAQAVHEDVATSLDALGRFVDALAGVRGRKIVLYLCDGLAMRPADELLATLQGRGDIGPDVSEATDSSFGANTVGGAGDSSVTRLQQTVEEFSTAPRFEQLVAMANTSRVTFYPIKAPAADAAGAQLDDDRQASSRRRLSDTLEALSLMADGTGGDVFATGTDVAGFLAAIAADLESYYSLGFYPRKHPNGSHHELRIRLKQKGLKLRHPKSYIYRSAPDLLSDRTVAALVLGIGENPYEIQISVASAEPRDDGTFDAGLVVGIPIGKLSLEERSGVYEGRARMVVALRTSQGHMPPVQPVEIPPLRIPQQDLEQARKQLFGARVDLRLPPGSQSVAIGLWDEVAATGSFLTEELRIGGQ